MIITIPEASHSNNDFKSGKFRHYHAYRHERNRWVWLVREQTGPPKTPIDSCEITITRYGKRLLDPDNLGGGCKILLDSLSINGVITDDRPQVIKKLHLDQYIDCKNPRTVVEIIPV